MKYLDQQSEQFRWQASVKHTALVPVTDAPLIGAIQEDIQAVLASGRTMKRCKARWVSLVDSADGPMVIKMFVERSRRHALKQAVQKSRALRHVKIANRLSSEGIATPEPVAIFEERLGPFNGSSCIMYRFVKGSTLRTQPNASNRGKTAELANSIRDAVQSHLCKIGERLVRTGMIYKDVHAENFIKDSSDQLHLIDLDSIRQTQSAVKKERCLQKFRMLEKRIVEGKV